MVYTIIRDGKYTGRELKEDEEWGYEDYTNDKSSWVQVLAIPELSGLGGQIATRCKFSYIPAEYLQSPIKKGTNIHGYAFIKLSIFLFQQIIGPPKWRITGTGCNLFIGC